MLFPGEQLLFCADIPYSKLKKAQEQVLLLSILNIKFLKKSRIKTMHITQKKRFLTKTQDFVYLCYLTSLKRMVKFYNV